MNISHKVQSIDKSVLHVTWHFLLVSAAWDLGPSGVQIPPSRSLHQSQGPFQEDHRYGE